MPINFLERTGVVEQEMAALIAKAPEQEKYKLGLLGIGLEMHFDWDKIKSSYQQAITNTKENLPPNCKLLCEPLPLQSRAEILAALNKYHAAGMKGLVIYQASFIAGDIALTIAQWLHDHNMPVLSWSHTEITGGNLTANRFCGQNFLLNVFSSMKLKYSWVFAAPGSDKLHTTLNRFARVIAAKASLKHRKLLMIGGMRVPGFYDCELNEISIARHFGLDVERIDLETLWQHGNKFTEQQINPIVEKLITAKQCNRNDVSEKELYLSVRFALAIADYTRGGGYLGIALKNWPELFERYGIAGDGAGALVQDLGIPVADESDMGGLLTMVTFNELTQGKGLPTLMDLSHLDAENNKIGMWHCGGTPTKLLRSGCQYQIRNHSILDNFDEATSCGMLLEFLQEIGPITIAKYQYPHASTILAFEGDVVESELRYRGCYGEVAPKATHAKSIISSVLTYGLDHHWIVARGHLLEDLREFNHWIGATELTLQPQELSGRSKTKNMNY